MKNFFAAITILASFSTFADNSPMTSIALEGDYQLIKTSGRNCGEKLSIDVSEKLIKFSWPDGLQTIIHSFENKCGFKPLHSDEVCMNFKKNSFTETDSDFTEVGYTKHTLKVKLVDDRLTIQRSSIAIPLGSLVTYDGDNFKCTYKKIN